MLKLKLIGLVLFVAMVGMIANGLKDRGAVIQTERVTDLEQILNEF